MVSRCVADYFPALLSIVVLLSDLRLQLRRKSNAALESAEAVEVPAPEKESDKQPPASTRPLTQLTDCIPLGTLQVPCTDASLAANADWKRADRLTDAVPADHELADVFSGLEQLEKLVITFKINPCNSEQLLLRVYVQADDRKDVTSKKISRSDGQLLLSKIDCSTAAWNGTEQSNAPNCGTEEDADIRSLFYLYNTLPSPEVDFSLTTDAHTNEAIHDVLSSDRSMPGLKTQLYPYQQRSAAVMIQREESPQKLLHPLLEAKTAAEAARIIITLRAVSFYWIDVSFRPVAVGFWPRPWG